jgi:hypothetical protein
MSLVLERFKKSFVSHAVCASEEVSAIKEEGCADVFYEIVGKEKSNAGCEMV